MDYESSSTLLLEKLNPVENLCLQHYFYFLLQMQEVESCRKDLRTNGHTNYLEDTARGLSIIQFNCAPTKSTPKLPLRESTL